MSFYTVSRRDNGMLLGIYEEDPTQDVDLDVLRVDWHRGPIPPLSKYQWDRDLLLFVQFTSAPITRLAFRNRFTAQEKRAIYAAAKRDADVEVWLDDLAQTVSVHLDNPQTIASVQALEAAGAIAVGRADEILTTPIAANELAE